MDNLPQWSEGLLQDGAAILRDGQMIPIYEFIELLNAYEKMKAFVNDLCEGAFDGCGYDGCELQEMMENYGIVILTTMHQPCGAYCKCLEMQSSDEFKNGVECYRQAEFLK